MDRKALVAQIQQKKSCLCVGLDTDLEKIPAHLLLQEDPIFAFNKAIIDATAPYCVAYKPNIAFFEAYGLEGWKSLEKTIAYLNTHYPSHFTIADAKRGDIGNTSTRYAKAFFDTLGFDSVTIAPYMGEDSVKPFLAFEGKWGIVLALTSNTGALDFQFVQDQHQYLFERVLTTTAGWGTEENTMFVVGATKAEYMQKVRACVPNHFLLVPGVGAQGGTVADVMEQAAIEGEVGLLINASRSILYASDKTDFAERAAEEARKLQVEMATIIG
jgi:orotidine-5'-phosphate decarboxylase